MTPKIRKVGRDFYLVFPMPLLKRMNLKIGMSVGLHLENGKLSVARLTKKRPKYNNRLKKPRLRKVMCIAC